MVLNTCAAGLWALVFQTVSNAPLPPGVYVLPATLSECLTQKECEAKSDANNGQKDRTYVSVCLNPKQKEK